MAIPCFAFVITSLDKSTPASARSHRTLTKVGSRLNPINSHMRKAGINPAFLMKKLPEKYGDATFLKSLYFSIIKTPMDFFYKLQGYKASI